jgi:hypothetical protein
LKTKKVNLCLEQSWKKAGSVKSRKMFERNTKIEKKKIF